ILANRYLLLQTKYLRLKEELEKFLKKKSGYKELRELLKELDNCSSKTTKKKKGNEPMKLSKEKIDAIFASANHQIDYLVGLYRAIFPDYDRIEQLEGFPEVDQTTSDYIWKKAIDFDRKHHPEVFAGGLWMNHGFSSNSSIAEGEISLSNVKIIRKRQEERDEGENTGPMGRKSDSHNHQRIC
ncbi:MAG: hypothetical protein DRG83_17505, partial [Deltaproteobacteria bacterium]